MSRGGDAAVGRWWRGFVLPSALEAARASRTSGVQPRTGRWGLDAARAIVRCEGASAVDVAGSFPVPRLHRTPSPSTHDGAEKLDLAPVVVVGPPRGGSHEAVEEGRL